MRDPPGSFMLNLVSAKSLRGNRTNSNLGAIFQLSPQF